MNWYTGAKVKPGQTDDSNFQDEEAADPDGRSKLHIAGLGKNTHFDYWSDYWSN